MGDVVGHEFHGNQWTGGGGGVKVDPTNQDKLSLEEARAAMRGLVKQYREDPNYRGAADVVASYARATQQDGLATRGIVERALKGKTAEQIAADPKVQKLIADINYHLNPDHQHSVAEYVRPLAAGAAGYYATVRDAQPTTDTVYRGVSKLPKGILEKSASGAPQAGAVTEFELQGPTAFTHSQDIAMTYAGGSIIEVVPGAKMLPVHEMITARRAALEGGDTEKYANVPAFYHRNDNAIDPRGSGYGYARDLDSDRELNTAGRFKVLGVTDKRILFRDAKSGKERLKTVNVVRVQHVGVF